MTAPQTSLRPGGATPAGGARHCPTCQCQPAPVCTCGHLPTSHDLPKRKAGYVRTGCSVSEGPKATPCGCTAYTPVEEP